MSDLERVLAEDNIDFLAAKLATPNLDAVPRDVFLNNRQDLLNEIQVAKDYFNPVLK